MEFKVATKAAAAASPVAARRGGALAGGAQGPIRVSFFGPARAPTRARALRVANNSVPPVTKEGRVDRSEILTLDSIRQTLIRLEDSIIFGLLERAQYRHNTATYDKNSFHMDGFEGSLVEYMVRETEKLHAQVGRYKSPDEHPFFPEDLPEPRLPPMQYPKALSKRIHYGKFVAEAKFQEAPEVYKPAIKAQDHHQLMQLLTYETVERAIEHRVEAKAKIFGQEVNIGAGNKQKVNIDAENNGQQVNIGAQDNGTPPGFKIRPSLVAELYSHRIMPLTKEVQVAYLLRRLD
nr:unnamed protein product [Digitaria exilis]